MDEFQNTLLIERYEAQKITYCKTSVIWNVCLWKQKVDYRFPGDGGEKHGYIQMSGKGLWGDQNAFKWNYSADLLISIVY